MSEPDQASPPGAPVDVLFDQVYQRLKAMAGSQRHRRGNAPTLGTTELVHELYLRMGSGHDKRFGDPAQFFAYAAKAMRHILVDAARNRLQAKSGGDQQRLPLTHPSVQAVEIDPAQAMLLDTALRALEEDDPRAARVVELHYFAGLSLQQIADVLGMARRTIDRDWRFARAFLLNQVG